MYDIENPMMPRRDSLEIYNEMQKIKKEIGQLQYRLMQLQQELNRCHQDTYDKYTCNKNDTYIMFNNGSEIEAIKSNDNLRGKGWFVDVDLVKEDSK
jgi:DNA anti-recombination protein RmuC